MGLSGIEVEVLDQFRSASLDRLRNLVLLHITGSTTPIFFHTALAVRPSVEAFNVRR
jgi:hypothetical protein